jgi:hypothetical protein
MANGDKYKSKKQLKKEGLMEKGGGIPSRPTWRNRIHNLTQKYNIGSEDVKRKHVEKSGSTLTGDYKKTKTIHDKSGNVKRTKTVTQITPVQKFGVGSGNYTAKVEKTGKETKYKTKNINPGSKAVGNAALGAIGVLGVNTLRSHLKI